MKVRAGIGVLLIVVIALGVFVPDHVELTPEGEFALTAIACHAEARQFLEPALLSYNMMGLQVECPGDDVVSEIRSGGVHVLRSSSLGHEFTFTPHVEGGAVKWACSGTPLERLPVSCRGGT